MANLGDLIGYDGEASEVLVQFTNQPSVGDALLSFRTATVITEGKTEKLPSGHITRLDKRPANQGGYQLHIKSPQGGEWAYRYDGSRSERSKYTLRTTNVIRGIVSTMFNLRPDQVEECIAVGLDGDVLVVEMTFR